MKSLIKVMCIFACIFASTFLLVRYTGLITVEGIESWLTMAKQSESYYLAGLVVMLLIVDLFVAVPTLTVIILSGYFLGPVMGTIASLVGLILAASIGYTLSARYGDKILSFIVKEQDKKHEVITSFQKFGTSMILLSRAMPILPEVCACMSGITHMPFYRFICYWLVSIVPYTVIAAYAGSISSINDPKPAIFAMIGLTLFLWCGWLVFNYRHKSSFVSNSG